MLKSSIRRSVGAGALAVLMSAVIGGLAMVQTRRLVHPDGERRA